MLSVLIWVPLIGAAIVAWWPGQMSSLHLRRVALAITLGLLVWNIAIVTQFHPEWDGMQLSEYVPWIEQIGFNYQVGIDGISLPLVCLNSLLTVVAIYSSDRHIDRPRLYYALLLLINFGVTGTFLAQDLLLFFLFYELELIPLYFLIAIWGGERRAYAATKFLLYTAISGILVLASFLGVVWSSGAATFGYEPLREAVLPLGTQIILLSGLLVAFGIKIPFFPFHTWLPDAHVEASTPISVLLAGVLLKLGTYGLLRFGLGLFPEAWQLLAPWLATWAAVSALYGALAAISQKDMKKVVAYSSIAHMAFILLAFAAATPLSLVASVSQMVSHGLISALLFLLVGVVAKKTGTRDVDQLRGLLNPERGLPLIGSLMILAAMASAGIPGMVGFIAEFMLFRGSFPVFPVQTLFCMVGTGLTAVYFLLMINKVFFGRLSERVENLPRVYWSDRLPAVALAIVVVIFGLQPNWLVRWSEHHTNALILGSQPRETGLLPIISVQGGDISLRNPVSGE
ncbi:MAG: NADH-quinone oxidoreductase subunit M [Oscillatoriaceae cyanobacterium]